MSFRGRGSGVMKITTEDFTGRKEIRQSVNLEDEEAVAMVFKSVIDKYGLDLKVISNNSNKLAWLKADEEFKW